MSQKQNKKNNKKPILIQTFTLLKNPKNYQVSLKITQDI